MADPARNRSAVLDGALPGPLFGRFFSLLGAASSNDCQTFLKVTMQEEKEKEKEGEEKKERGHSAGTTTALK
ncbi:hypothetical protein A0H81_07682 [Grifola frondosa]|uniref:Uncharacterized protein n=1 Tax=Grifola frondosa TaxID=5627 RepID=A0A1C7M6N3_GRIFR|nr:hypothetical protein A0H81_07682 [Grifola frondosa]